MKGLFVFIFTIFSGYLAGAQSPPTAGPRAQDYGKVDKADLELKECDFEKDANAEYLFVKSSLYFDSYQQITYDYHVRIKIFNEKGTDASNIKIRYLGGMIGDYTIEYISGVQAQTINLNSGKVEITKVDKKQIFNQRVDRRRNVLSFVFPDVKPGSVLEYKYTITTPFYDLFPAWYFQKVLPVRYSEFDTKIPYTLFYKKMEMTTRPLLTNTDEVKTMVNIPSLRIEPYMTSLRDNAERILYQLKNINEPGYNRTYADTWEKVGKDYLNFPDFGYQIKRSLNAEDELITKAKKLPTDKEKIAYIFNEVKNTMKWNEYDSDLTDDGTTEAWKKKTGNSTEINLILNHLLQKAGLISVPMLVSTKENGKINPAFPSLYFFNKTVAYIPIDSANYYLLDATNKYNIFNEIPLDLLNGFGLVVDKASNKYDIVFIQKPNPVRELSNITAEIKPNGKMDGSVQFSSLSYNRIKDIELYKTIGEEKYIKQLAGDDNSLKISGLKFENMEVDSLPLNQTFNFQLDLTGSDENYIYFKPNFFADEYSSEFLSENRYSDIDFGYLKNKTINGSYKIPAGFKVDAMPKSVGMALPDNSIVFKRLVAEQDGAILVRYSLIFKKSLFFKENYADFHEFFKKMAELLNEQIVLKKI